MGLRDCIAVVTKSSRGIREAIAYGLAKEGAQVTICARNLETLMETAKTITASTGTEISLSVQISKTRKIFR